MKQLDTKIVRDEVSRLCILANYELGDDIVNALEENREKDSSALARNVLGALLENAQIAKAEGIPLCQDTGIAVVYAEIGQELLLVGQGLNEAIQDGIRQGYDQGYLRKSVVLDPFVRDNSQDNTPGVIYTEIVPGDKLKLTIAPKGFGSENMSVVKMLTPADGIEGVKRVVLDAVMSSGPNPCPPLVVGVGIGGTMDKAAYLSKKALTRRIDSFNESEHIASLEKSLLTEINKLDIGPQGFGGDTTALGVNVEVYPTHIAGLPVAVNVGCHATRHKSVIIGG